MIPKPFANQNVELYGGQFSFCKIQTGLTLFSTRRGHHSAVSETYAEQKLHSQNFKSPLHVSVREFYNVPSEQVLCNALLIRSIWAANKARDYINLTSQQEGCIVREIDSSPQEWTQCFWTALLYRGFCRCSISKAFRELPQKREIIKFSV